MESVREHLVVGVDAVGDRHTGQSGDLHHSLVLVRFAGQVGSLLLLARRWDMFLTGHLDLCFEQTREVEVGCIGSVLEESLDCMAEGQVWVAFVGSVELESQEDMRGSQETEGYQPVEVEHFVVLQELLVGELIGFEVELECHMVFGIGEVLGVDCVRVEEHQKALVEVDFVGLERHQEGLHSIEQ